MTSELQVPAEGHVRHKVEHLLGALGMRYLGGVRERLPEVYGESDP